MQPSVQQASNSSKQNMMKAVILQAANKLTIKQVPIPKPQHGEVLIKVMAAPINPSDLAFIAVGQYSDTKKTPCIAGFQGSGLVIENGGGLMGWSLTTKKVAFTPTEQSGSYAQYALAKTDQCVPVQEDMSFQQACMSLVNPLTCIGFLDVAKTMGAKTIIHTAAASQLGRMVVRFFLNQGVNVINIVRREQQVQVLKQQGAQFILNSTDSDFEDKLKKMATEMKATLAFDAIGGNMTGILLKNMPNKSTSFIYGLLSKQPMQSVDTVDMLYNDKTMKGFFLPNWLKTKSMVKLLPTMYKLRKLLKKQLTSKISKQVGIQGFEQGMEYYLNNMTKGKVIVKPWAAEQKEIQQSVSQPVSVSNNKKEQNNSSTQVNKKQRKKSEEKEDKPQLAASENKKDQNNSSTQVNNRQSQKSEEKEEKGQALGPIDNETQ